MNSLSNMFTLNDISEEIVQDSVDPKCLCRKKKLDSLLFFLPDTLKNRVNEKEKALFFWCSKDYILFKNIEHNEGCTFIFKKYICGSF